MLNAQAKTRRHTKRAFCFKWNLRLAGIPKKMARQSPAKSLAPDGQHKNTKQVLCQEYVLQADRIIYRITPKMTSTLFSCQLAKRPNSGFTKTSCCFAFPKLTARSVSISFYQ